MKLSKLLSVILACSVLLAAMCVPASAEETTIDFAPIVKSGKIYGTDLKTSQSLFCDIFSDKSVEVYNKGKLIEDPAAYVGTGHTIQFDGKFLYTAVVMGDIDGDGELTTKDFALIKMAYFELTTISGIAMQAAGVEDGDELRALNYLKVKRAYFGLYDMNAEYRCDPYTVGSSGSDWNDKWV